MKYFMPDWADRVDPGFDFHKDAFTPSRDVAADVYAHELFEVPPYDGILLSRAVVEKSKSEWEALQSKGARAYLRLPQGLEVFGDCGAFSYVDQERPRYETEDVLEYYATIGVDYGASVDHLAVGTIRLPPEVDADRDGRYVVTRQHRVRRLSEDERARRVELTLENAEKFLRLHRRHRYRFIPVGVAQGWDPATYAASVQALARMGYRYIALGGLARSTGPQILQVLKAVRQALDDLRSVIAWDVRLHLFGVAKVSLLPELPKYGVVSIDSASHLRKAWLRSGQNYLAPDGTWYTAIRVPQSDHPKVRDLVSRNGRRLDDIRMKERQCLELLDAYDNGIIDRTRLEELLHAIVDYDMYLLRRGDDGMSLRNRATMTARYRRTLLDRPWDRCPCPVCRQLGIHVVIFRGTNRNKRRGFHNTWTFYQFMRSRELATRLV